MPTGKVYWYNAGKGYGFIVPNDGSRDVFVHAAAVRLAGGALLLQGQPLSFDIESDPLCPDKKHAVNLVLDNGDKRIGTVKWYNATKGYGFITIDDGRDVFVHANALKRTELVYLPEGARVSFREVRSRSSGKTSAEGVVVL